MEHGTDVRDMNQFSQLDVLSLHSSVANSHVVAVEVGRVPTAAHIPSAPAQLSAPPLYPTCTYNSFSFDVSLPIEKEEWSQL
jgi:hypothetical protein